MRLRRTGVVVKRVGPREGLALPRSAEGALHALALGHRAAHFTQGLFLKLAHPLPR